MRRLSPLYLYRSALTRRRGTIVDPACSTFRQPGAVRSDADHPVDATHLPLHPRTCGMARSSNDPLRRQLANQLAVAVPHGGARDGRDGRLGRCALDARTWRLLFLLHFRRLICRQTSSREDGDGEWLSEGVQLGGRGSAIGVIGMWTSAEHEPSDPLGSCHFHHPSCPTVNWRI